MNIFDRYIFKNVSIACVFIAVTLIVIVFLTQSLRFLELVIDSGASSVSFWILTLLALPRFFEILLPLALMGAVLFVYNRMANDSELSAVKSLGKAPLVLARPALILAAIITVFLWSVTLWLAPKSLAQMQYMRQVVKASFSALLLREGVFNPIGDGLTVYIRERAGPDELRGIMIHDAREENVVPATIIAKRGAVVADEEGFEVVVFDGSRQQVDPEKNVLQRLNFERYVIDLPDSGPVRQRWKEPDERTIFELLNPDLDNLSDQRALRDFQVEIHKRLTSPLLTIGFTAIACACLLLGPVNRRSHAKRILMVIGCVMVLESLFLAAGNIARHHVSGLVLLYVVSLGPIIAGLFFLSPVSETFRRQVFYGTRQIFTKKERAQA